MPEFEIIKNEIVRWIRDWFSKNGPGCNAIVGISGGKDSSVVAALCAEALGRDRVIGVLMPCLTQDDIEYSHLLVDFLRIRSYTVPISLPVASLLAQMGDADITPTTQATVNLPARIRMATLYAVSQSMNGRVANTSNLSEDYIGWSTRYGDGAGDFCPIARLTAGEVVEVGRVIGLPDDLIEKVPSDGLTGKTDEDNFGFTYDALDRYILTGECENDAIREKIDAMHQKNLFKLSMPPCCEARSLISYE